MQWSLDVPVAVPRTIFSHAGGEVVVHAGLVVTIGAIVGVYVGHWVLFVIALLGAAVWITGDIVVHVSRQRSPDISPATPVRHPVGRAA